MFTYHKINYLSITIFIYIIASMSCNSRQPNPADVKQTEEAKYDITLTQNQWKEAGIKVAPLDKQKIKKTTTLTGHLMASPNQTITVSSQIKGKVTKIMIEHGQLVSKGQVLMILEDPEVIQWQEAYLSTKTALQFAIKDFQRQKTLNQNNAVSDKVLETSEEKMLQLQLENKVWEEKLKMLQIQPATLTPESVSSLCSIRANQSGMVTDVHVNLGKYINSGNELITMVSLSTPVIVLKAFEKDLYDLMPGMTVSISSNEKPHIKWPAIIDKVIPRMLEGGYAEVYASFAQNPTSLFPGNFIHAEIEVSDMESHVVPESALVTFEDKDYIFIESGEKSYKMVEVTKGQIYQGKTPIMLKQNFHSHPVVISGAYTLLMALHNKEE